MKLNEEQKKKVLSRLQEMWKDQKICEICGTNKWLIDDTVFEIREYHGGATVLGSGAIKPLLTLVCSNCGNTKFMNALKFEIFDTTSQSVERGGSNG